MHIGKKFDPATVLTMPMPKLEHVKGYFVPKDIGDKERTVGFTIRAHPEETFGDLREKIKHLQRDTDVPLMSDKRFDIDLTWVVDGRI